MNLLTRALRNFITLFGKNIEWYFDIREFCIVDSPIPQDVADKIFKYHIIPMNYVRHKFGRPVIVSKRSGYRPREYELSKGRNGNSLHTFSGEGAADYTHSGDWAVFLKLMMKHTDYKRICYYPNNNFIHADYAGNRRLFYTAQSPASSWKYVGTLEDFNADYLK